MIKQVFNVLAGAAHKFYVFERNNWFSFSSSVFVTVWLIIAAALLNIEYSLYMLQRFASLAQQEPVFAIVAVFLLEVVWFQAYLAIFRNKSLGSWVFDAYTVILKAYVVGNETGNEFRNKIIVNMLWFSFYAFILARFGVEWLTLILLFNIMNAIKEL